MDLLQSNKSLERVGTILGVTLVMLLTCGARAWAGPVQWNSGPNNNGHWYEVIVAPGGITWDKAMADAQARGGYLATILSAEENAFAFSLVDSPAYWIAEAGGPANVGPWLGGSQPPGSPEPAGGWTWVHGDGPFVYTNWHGGEPSNGEGSPHGQTESRLEFFEYGGRSSAWNDAPESSSCGIVCPIAYVVEYDAMCVVDPSYAGTTLTLNFTISSPHATQWHVAALASGNVATFWKVQLPAVEPAASFSLPIPNVPHLGNIGFLSTFTGGGGLECTSLRTVDTGAASPGTTLELLRRSLGLNQ
jgi:lectin-like protein